MNRIESRTARPRWERRKDARPSELLAAALSLFVEKGYAGTRLDDVAARAGVSKGTLYLYFDNKEDLFKAVVRENISRNIEAGREEAAKFEGHSAQLLRYLIGEWFSRIASGPASGIAKLMIAESGNFPEIASFYLAEVIEPAHALMQGVIRRGIGRSEFRRVDPGLFVHTMFAPMVMLLLWKHSFGPCSSKALDPKAYLALHIENTIAALRPEPQAQPKTSASRATKRRSAGLNRAVHA